MKLRLKFKLYNQDLIKELKKHQSKICFDNMTQTISMLNFENKINRYSQTESSSFTHLKQRFTQTSSVQLENRSTQTNQEKFDQPMTVLSINTREPPKISNVQNSKYQNKNLLYKGDQHEFNDISDVSFSGGYFSYQTNKCMIVNSFFINK